MKHLALTFVLVAILQSDPVTGMWYGQYTGVARVENGIRVELRLSGNRLEGAVLTESEKYPIEKGSFSPDTGRIHFEVYFEPDNLRYIIDGILKDREIRGTWKHQRDGGPFELIR